jgi:hypothetical protein
MVITRRTAKLTVGNDTAAENIAAKAINDTAAGKHATTAKVTSAEPIEDITVNTTHIRGIAAMAIAIGKCRRKCHQDSARDTAFENTVLEAIKDAANEATTETPRPMQSKPLPKTLLSKTPLMKPPETPLPKSLKIPLPKSLKISLPKSLKILSN